MSCDLALLERGAVCLALYPYITGFPMEIVDREGIGDEFMARLERHEDIDSLARTVRDGPSPEIVVTMKLRRVLLLQDGTSPGRQDVLVARVNSVTDEKRAKATWFRKLENGIHPLYYLLRTPEQGVTKDAYVDPLYVMPIKKAAILRRTGMLSTDEMREISDRLIRALELDLSHHRRQPEPQPEA